MSALPFHTRRLELPENRGWIELSGEFNPFDLGPDQRAILFYMADWFRDFERSFQPRIEKIERLPHETRPIQVWVDADIGIADVVDRLNDIEGVRTESSCQGTIGEGGPNPYRAQVMCTWTPEALVKLREEFDVEPEGNGSWGYVHPRESK